MDTTARRLRRTEDLLDLALTLLGIGAVLILAIYARQTTTGVTQDVQNALAVVLRRILVFPLQAVEGLTTFTCRWPYCSTASCAAPGAPAARRSCRESPATRSPSPR